MPTWRCPHCGTPQSDTSRCWVCKRPSTSCGTCRHFRTSIAGRRGYCGLDSRRIPLSSGEIRGCWEVAMVTDVAKLPPVWMDRAPAVPRARARRAPRRQTLDPLLTFWSDEP